MSLSATAMTRVVWGAGALSDAVRASQIERLQQFIVDEESEAIAIFSPESRANSDAGDWYGEHAGKWLIAASDCWTRTGDETLRANIERVVATLCRHQEPNGYLGTYATGAPCRFTSPLAAKSRTWDLWVHSWLILGLLKAHQIPGSEGAKEAAKKIGELILDTFPRVHKTVLDLGNHSGLSSSIVIEPLVELALATGDDRFACLAADTVSQMRSRGFLDESKDVSEIGTGKAYQILWTLVGMLSLFKATRDQALLEDVQRLWQNISDQHLTPLGGPWGGVATHKEVFNPKGFFSPNGLVETCSAATWMILNRKLFELTGDAKYVDAFELTLMNTILGAIDQNGRDWCYFTFPNGRRNNTYHWACCKSSGAMALEEAAKLAATETEKGIAVHLLTPFEAVLDGKFVKLEPVPGGLALTASFDGTVSVRRPDWLEGDLNGTYRHIDVTPGETTILEIDAPIRVAPFTYTIDHHGQEVVRTDYACVSRGPYVYATGLIDGFKKEETLRLPRLMPEAPFKAVGEEQIHLNLPGRSPILFEPYYKARGRHEGAWRSTWLQVAWQ